MSFFQTIYQYKEKGIQTNITIRSRSQIIEEISAHLLVLTAKSKYFEAMFMNNTKEAMMEEVDIKYPHPFIIADIINELYEQKTNIGSLPIDEHELKKIICRDYFRIENTLDALSGIKISLDNFDLLFRVAEIFNYNDQIRKIVIDNIGDHNIDAPQEINDMIERYVGIRYLVVMSDYMNIYRVDENKLTLVKKIGNTGVTKIMNYKYGFCFIRSRKNKKKQSYHTFYTCDYPDFDPEIKLDGYPKDCLISFEGKRIYISYNDDFTMYLTERETRRRATKMGYGVGGWFGTDYYNHKIFCEDHQVSRSHHREIMASHDLNNVIHLWDTEKIKFIKKIILDETININLLEFTPDDQYLICSTEKNNNLGHTFLINIEKGNIEKIIIPIHDTFIDKIMFTSDHIIMIDENNNIFILDKYFDIVNNFTLISTNVTTFSGKKRELIYSYQGKIYSFDFFSGKKRDLAYATDHICISDMISVEILE